MSEASEEGDKRTCFWVRYAIGALSDVAGMEATRPVERPLRDALTLLYQVGIDRECVALEPRNLELQGVHFRRVFADVERALEEEDPEFFADFGADRKEPCLLLDQARERARVAGERVPNWEDRLSVGDAEGVMAELMLRHFGCYGSGSQ